MTPQRAADPAPAGPAEARWPRRQALTIGLFATIVVVLWILSPQGTCLDFTVFHRAGRRWLHGEDLYQLSDGHFAWKYAPIAAAFFALLGPLPLRLGWLAMNCISLLALLRVIRFAMRRLGHEPGRLEQALVLAAAAPWYGHLFWLGQSDGVVLYLLIESEAQSERRPLIAGALWALACLVKPPFLVLFLVVALRRQWLRAAGFALGLGFWLVLGVLRYGVTSGLVQLRGWWSLLSSSTPELICNEWNQGAWAITCTYLAPFGTPRFLPTLLAFAALLVAGGLLLVREVHRVDRERGRFLLFSFALYLGAFLSPLGWNTNLVSALPLAYGLGSVATGGPTARLRRAATAILGVVAFLNCVDLLLLPFTSWLGDTTLLLLQLRQYGVAGLLAASGSLACLALAARHQAAARRAVAEPALVALSDTERAAGRRALAGE